MPASEGSGEGPPNSKSRLVAFLKTPVGAAISAAVLGGAGLLWDIGRDVVREEGAKYAKVVYEKHFDQADTDAAKPHKQAKAADKPIEIAELTPPPAPTPPAANPNCEKVAKMPPMSTLVHKKKQSQPPTLQQQAGLFTSIGKQLDTGFGIFQPQPGQTTTKQ